MMKIFRIAYMGLLLLPPSTKAQAQQDTAAWKQIYRGSAPKVNEMVHTKLEARFDYRNTCLYGKAWLTLRPHFYPTDSLTLDAKRMDIAKVLLVTGNNPVPLKYTYDSLKINITLPRQYTAKESYQVYIEYRANGKQPVIGKTGTGGLYFINPTGVDKNKPVQVWTDSENEFASCWMPCIDHPNQKSTEEIFMNVPAQYVTLSNGRLVRQIRHPDGTRTDDWRMDLPNAPYLFFMAVGDFAIIKDSYHGKEVNYYVEHAYAAEANGMFGSTPAMIACFEKITGVAYPWVKYDQIVLRDFTSAAMENTSSTAHSEGAQQDARQLADGNRWESNTAHELFHQWFGDYVTCESWSNTTLNESFANYGQYLWKEHAYGADAAADQNYTDMQTYLDDHTLAEKDLVPFYYADPADDAITYEKGGRILHMLRTYIGDNAFYKGIHLYLTRYKFQSAEVHQLRLVMEEVTGMDLNWFFNQWYFGSGHPKVTIDYHYNNVMKKAEVIIHQNQGAYHLFKIPLAIDIYQGQSKTRRNIWLTKERDTLSFACTQRPDLINVDASKYMLWEKTDNKTLANYIFQYKYAATYMDRREAIAACSKQPNDPAALAILVKALQDPFDGLRIYTLNVLDSKSETVRQATEQLIYHLAQTDPRPLVRAAAIDVLGSYRDQKYASLFKANLNDISYTVSGDALLALAKIDSAAAYTEAKRQSKLLAKGMLDEAVATTLLDYAQEADFDLISAYFAAKPFKFRFGGRFIKYLTAIKSPDKVAKGVDVIVTIRAALPPEVAQALNERLLTVLLNGMNAQGRKQEAAYIQTMLAKTP